MFWFFCSVFNFRTRGAFPDLADQFEVSERKVCCESGRTGSESVRACCESGSVFCESGRDCWESGRVCWESGRVCCNSGGAGCESVGRLIRGKFSSQLILAILYLKVKNYL